MHDTNDCSRVHRLCCRVCAALPGGDHSRSLPMPIALSDMQSSGGGEATAPTQAPPAASSSSSASSDTAGQMNAALLPVHVSSASSLLSLNPRSVSNSFPLQHHHQRIKDASASPPAVAAPVATIEGTSLHAQVLALQAENAAAKEELALLRNRLRQIEQHNISIPPTVGAPAPSSFAPPAPSPPPFDSGSNHWEEHEAIAAWQHAQALDIPLPLRQNVEQFDAEPFLRPEAGGTATTSAASARLHRDVSQLLSHLQPSRRSESRRANVLAFLKLLVRKSLGSQLYPLGAFALKTYVGNDVMEVSAFFSRAHENTWLHRIVSTQLNTPATRILR